MDKYKNKKELKDRLQTWLNKRVDPISIASLYQTEIFNLPSYYITRCIFHEDSDIYSKTPMKIYKSVKTDFSIKNNSKYYFRYCMECSICGKFSATQFISKMLEIDDFKATVMLMHKLNITLVEPDKSIYEREFTTEMLNYE